MRILLSAKDAGRLLGVGPVRVQQLANEGRLRVAFRDTVGRRLFRERDVLKLVEARRRRAEVAVAHGDPSL